MKKQPNVWRTTYEVPERKWPVVSRKALGDLTPISDDWNSLVHALANAYVQFHNAGLWAKQARVQAQKAGKHDLVKELDKRLEELKATLKNWPMEIVG